jgi:hypothetical protein
VAVPPNPFAEPGLWLRCALHAHTTNSDGELPPHALVQHYEWAGFDVLAITDHWVRTEARSTDGLLVIPSVELNARAGGPDDDAHVLALGVADVPAAPEDGFAPLPDVVAWVDAHGGVPYLAHSYWSGLRTDQFEGCEALCGIEVWNAGCELEVGRGDGTIHWDEALERGRLLYGIAADDSHHPGYDSSLAWVWARCAERSTAAVLTALREGRFYSSTGPSIHEVSLDDGGVVVRCSPAASVTLVAGRRRGARVNAGRLGYPHRASILERNDEGAIVAARLQRPPGAPYGRVEVADEAGRRAWTNPLWI